MADQVTITGVIAGIGYRSSEGWATFTVDENNDEFGYSSYSCTGTLPVIVDLDSDVTCTGRLVKSPKYGEQLKCESVIPSPPDTKTDAGLCKLLQRIPGIGPAKAQVYIDRCKENNTDPVENAIQRPETIPCREGDESMVSALLVELTQLFEHIIYLLGIGLTDSEADKILREFSVESTEVVSQNPYMLIDKINGIGFMKADKIAFKAGITSGNQARTMSCIKYCLKDSQVNGGNTKIKGWKLCRLVADILRESCVNNRASVVGLPVDDDIRDAVYILQNDGKVVVKDGWVYDVDLLQAEKTIFESLNKKLKIEI